MVDKEHRGVGCGIYEVGSENIEALPHRKSERGINRNRLAGIPLVSDLQGPW